MGGNYISIILLKSCQGRVVVIYIFNLAVICNIANLKWSDN